VLYVGPWVWSLFRPRPRWRRTGDSKTRMRRLFSRLGVNHKAERNFMAGIFGALGCDWLPALGQVIGNPLQNDAAWLVT
jgi:hypothetical protein